MIFALPLLLSEVLANEPGSATSLEFVELVARHPVREGFAILDANGKIVGVPEVPLDSGKFLVVCRDRGRFEEHFGDSSGAWGDSNLEDYALQEFSMSLPNAEGYVAVLQEQLEDRAEWTGDAADGVSYERVSDSLWQPTDATVGSTPGHRNHGIAPDSDWSIEQMRIEPPLPSSGMPARFSVRIGNRGQRSSSGEFQVVREGVDSLPLQSYSGPPGLEIDLHTEILPRSGFNRLQVSLSGDDKSDNNKGEFTFYADATPVAFSEFYPAPLPGQPEWIELAVPADFHAAEPAIALCDANDSVVLPPELWLAGTHRYVVVTADSVLFELTYPGVPPPVFQPPRWPSLNNDGDTLALTLQGATVDRAGYPTFGARRGVSFERVGVSATWGWAVAENGSTPGAANSIDVPYAPGIEVQVDPNPFAVTLGERANIQYRVPFGAVGDLRLFRGDGRLVRTLFEKRPVVSGVTSWNGQADNGLVVPVGIYVVQFRLFEPQEQVYLGTVVVAR